MNKLALLLALLVSAAVQAEIYRWVDENGVTIYSQTPPPDSEAKRIKTSPAPTGAENSQRQLEEEMQKLEDYREDKALAEEKRQKEERERQLNEENCRKARSNLDNLTALSRRLLKMPDGSYQRLTEEQRQQKMEEARKMIEKYCK